MPVGTKKKQGDEAEKFPCRKKGWYTACARDPREVIPVLAARLAMIVRKRPSLFFHLLDSGGHIKLVLSVDGFSYTAFNGESVSLVQGSVRVVVPGFPIDNAAMAHIPLLLA